MRGLLGFRAQSMGGARRSVPVLVQQVLTSASGSLVTKEDCIADIFAFGAGGSGASRASGSSGGTGGAAGYSRLALAARSLIAWNVGVGGLSAGNPGNDIAGQAGGDTTISINGVLLGTAGGGPGGLVAAPAPRSAATGFQINRYGGGSAEAGEFGGASGADRGGGGGGFSDMFEGVIGGAGGEASPPSVPTSASFAGGGGAGVSQRYSGYGGSGLVVINLYRLA